MLQLYPYTACRWKTQNFHWNVTGPQFHSLHEMFEAQYTELADGAVAVRISTAVLMMMALTRAGDGVAPPLAARHHSVISATVPAVCGVACEDSALDCAAEDQGFDLIVEGQARAHVGPGEAGRHLA